MILFVFEGKREKNVYRSIGKIFFPEKEDDYIVCTFNNNIHKLYKELKSYGEDGDIVSILRNEAKKDSDNPLNGYDQTSLFSEVYLFFDYDLHDPNVHSILEKNQQVQEMLDFFNDETGNGKLYIDYPMFESIRYTKKLPDPNYYEYTVLVSCGSGFKELSKNFSDYKNLDFITLCSPKLKGGDNRAEVERNWKYLVKQNVFKANYICRGKNEKPVSKSDVSQINIFYSQVEKYVNVKPEGCISVLNSFPLFIYEYFKEDLL